MNKNIYKIFVSGSDRHRFKQLIDTFEDINRRIIDVTQGNLFVRVLVELTDEEITIIKLSFSTEECIVLSGTDADMNKSLYASLIEGIFKPRM